MSEPIDELKGIASELTAFQKSFESSECFKQLERLKEVASDVGQSWSRSWLGYQSLVYYSNLKAPPPGHHFSSEWGFHPGISDTTGDWREFEIGVVEGEIRSRAGNPDLSAAKGTAKIGLGLFLEKKESLGSILNALNSTSSDPYLHKLLDEANALLPTSQL